MIKKMTIEPNKDEIIYFHSLHVLEIYNKTKENIIEIIIQNDKIHMESVNNIPFSYKYENGGFPFRLDKCIFVDEIPSET